MIHTYICLTSHVLQVLLVTYICTSLLIYFLPSILPSLLIYLLTNRNSDSVRNYVLQHKKVPRLLAGEPINSCTFQVSCSLTAHGYSNYELYGTIVIKKLYVIVDRVSCSDYKLKISKLLL